MEPFQSVRHPEDFSGRFAQSSGTFVFVLSPPRFRWFSTRTSPSYAQPQSSSAPSNELSHSPHQQPKELKNVDLRPGFSVNGKQRVSLPHDYPRSDAFSRQRLTTPRGVTPSNPRCVPRCTLLSTVSTSGRILEQPCLLASLVETRERQPQGDRSAVLGAGTIHFVSSVLRLHAAQAGPRFGR